MVGKAMITATTPPRHALAEKDRSERRISTDVAFFQPQTAARSVQWTRLVSGGEIEMSNPSRSPAMSDVFPVQERRGEWRTKLDVPCVALLHGQRRRCRLIDLSCGGAAIAYDGREPPEGVHTVHLATRGGSFRVLARTVWRERDRHGVCFLALDAGDRVQIAEALDGMLAVRRRSRVA